MSNTALILLGHGSHISPETAGVVWEQVDRLRAAGAADEVTAAFWKEAPSFATVLNSIQADNITVVPLFTARGYFTQTVIPSEIDLQGETTTRGGNRIRYTPTLGEHPAIADLVRRRAEDAIRESNMLPQQIAVALIGHSTRRNPESRRATEAQVARLRALNVAAEVVAVYLDDTPDIPSLYDSTSAPTVIAVPYFLAFGSHVSMDVPAELGLPPGAMHGVVNGRTVVYTPPLNDADAITSMIGDLAGVKTDSNPSADAWQRFPQAGRGEFAYWLCSRGRGRLLERDFGGLYIAPISGGWRIQAKDDPTPTTSMTRLHTPGDLRRWVRGNAPETFRPLPTSTDLPGGWFVEVRTLDRAHAVVETVYPGAVAEWALTQHTLLSVHSLDTVIARQTGMYRRLALVSQAERVELVTSVCGGCVRAPTWATGETHPIPCPEACNWWMTRALEHLEGAQKAEA